MKAGERLRAVRLALDLRARDVCEAINVQANTYSQYESGVSLLDINAAVRLRERFGISLDWLYCGDLGSLTHKLGEKVKQILDKPSVVPAGEKRPFKKAS